MEERYEVLGVFCGDWWYYVWVYEEYYSIVKEYIRRVKRVVFLKLNRGNVIKFINSCGVIILINW